jgi:hypothetical protein
MDSDSVARLGPLKPEQSPQMASKPPMTHRRTFQWRTPSITKDPGVPVASSAPSPQTETPTETLRTPLDPRMALRTAPLAPSVEAETVESPTLVVIRVDTDLLGTAGALNSRVCKTARATLNYGSAGLWDPTDSMVHQARQSPNSNLVMTLPSHPTNHLFGRIWCIRRLLRASQPLQQQAPQMPQIQVHLHHGLFRLRIPTLRMPRRSCCAGINVLDTSRSGASSS